MRLFELRNKLKLVGVFSLKEELKDSLPHPGTVGGCNTAGRKTVMAVGARRKTMKQVTVMKKMMVVTMTTR